MSLRIDENSAESEQKNRLEKRRLMEKVCEIAESNLAPQKKLLFLLYYRHGYTQKDIAAFLGTRENNVTRRLATIRRQLMQVDGKIKKERKIIRKGQFV